MRSTRIDQWLLSLGMMLILMSSYFLFWYQEGQGSALSLGRLAATTSIVKTKTPFTLDWRDAFSGIEVSENQLVYTDQNSSADIVFHSGDEVKVGENSLIRITAGSNSQGMDVGQGQIEAKIKSGSPLEVSLNGEDYTISSKDARVQINWMQGKGEIGVSDGSVVIEKEGTREQVSPDNVLVIEGSKAKLTSIAYKLKQPSAKALLTTVDNERAVSFVWDPAIKAQLEVTSLLTKKVQSVDAESGVTLNLQEGSYQWRVRTDQGVSLTSTFTVLQEKPLQVLRPLTDEVVEVVEANNKVQILLQWQGNAFEQYDVEYDLNGKTETLSTKGSSSLLDLTEKPESFRWRARLNKVGRELAQWSEWQQPSIQVITAPTVPENLAPHEVEFQVFEKGTKTAIDLSWTSKHKVLVEIVQPVGVTTISSQSNEAIYSTSGPGSYKWRAMALDVYNRESEWSEWKTFEVVDLSADTDKGKWQRIQLKKPNQEVTFEWKADEGSTSVFEISQDENFKEVIKTTQVKGGSTKVAVPRVGTYYWRSRLYRPDGTYEVSEPKRVIIEQGPPPGKPEKLPDMEVPLEWQESTQTQFKLWHLLIAPAYADDQKSVATIKLPVHEEAKSFHLRIFTKDDEKTPVFDKEINSTEFEWVGAEPGEYLWQYAIVDFWGRKSPYSDLSQLTITVGTPRRPLLISPIKAQVVKPQKLKLEWKDPAGAQSYDLIIATDADFKNIAYQKKKLKSSSFQVPEELKTSGLHYWQVKARHKGAEVVSSTGRFTLQREGKLIDPIVTHVPKSVGSFEKRIFVGWIPAKETFEFTDTNQQGEISGNTLMGIMARGHYNISEYMFTGEFIRQSGKVFKGESYLFRKLQIEAGYKWRYGSHLFLLGGGLAQIASQEYEISNNKVTASSLSSLSVGPVVRGFHPLTDKSEIQSKFAYLLSSIKEIELSAEYLHHHPEYFWAAGLGYFSREIVEGEQSSLRFTLGLGKDF